MRIDLGCLWPEVFGRRSVEASRFAWLPMAWSLYDIPLFGQNAGCPPSEWATRTLNPHETRTNRPINQLTL
jgi:hypothetical protein